MSQSRCCQNVVEIDNKMEQDSHYSIQMAIHSTVFDDHPHAIRSEEHSMYVHFPYHAPLAFKTCGQVGISFGLIIDDCYSGAATVRYSNIPKICISPLYTCLLH